MNPTDAVRLMVKHYPGGVDALAVLVGKSGETLRKEIAGAHGYKLGVNDACAISEACIAVGSEHCRAYANAVAANCGGFVRLPVLEPVQVGGGMGDLAGQLRTLQARIVKESSDVLGAGERALSDGDISDNDYREQSRENHELIAVVQEHQRTLDAAYEASKAKVQHLRKVG
jgi:hypothetical protein